MNVSIEEVIKPNLCLDRLSISKGVKDTEVNFIPATSDENLFACCTKVDDLMTLVNLSTKVCSKYHPEEENQEEVLEKISFDDLLGNNLSRARSFGPGKSLQRVPPASNNRAAGSIGDHELADLVR